MTIVNPDYSENKFNEIPKGSHKVRIIAAKQEFNKYQNCDTMVWELEIFANEDQPIFNGRKIWHRTPLAGQFSGQLKFFLQAANPEYGGGGFDPETYMNRELEVEIDYPISKKTGQPSQYPAVKRVSPIVGSIGGGMGQLDDIPL